MKTTDQRPAPIVFMWTLHAGYDGIITLIHRSSAWLTARGHQVLILCRDGIMVTELEKTGATVVVLSRFEMSHTLHTPEEFFGMLLRLKAKLPEGARPNFITFDPTGLYICDQLALITHGKAFFYLPHPSILDRVPTALIKKLDAMGRLFSVNQGCLEAVRVKTGLELKRAHLLPVPVDPPAASLPRTRGRKILSVSRLAPDKRYTLALVRLMPALRTKVPDATLEIVGEGPLQRELAVEIEAQKAGGYVSMVGKVPPSQLPTHYEGCAVHVGMGTTAVLAAMYGRPSIVAFIDEQEPRTPGLLQDQPGYNFGERLPPVDTVPLLYALEELLTQPEQAREAGERGRAYVLANFTLEKTLPRLLLATAEADDGDLLVERDYLTDPPASRAHRWVITRHHLVQLLRTNEQAYHLVRRGWLVRRRALETLRNWRKGHSGG